jgi:hypothetical protein
MPYKDPDRRRQVKRESARRRRALETGPPTVEELRAQVAEGSFIAWIVLSKYHGLDAERPGGASHAA